MASYADHLRLAHELKQTLNTLMGWSGPMTHRQFAVWRKWLHDEWERPSRADKYIMRLTYIVDNMFTESGKLPPEDDYRLKYAGVRTAQPTQPPTQSSPTSTSTLTPSSQEDVRVKEFMGDADPATIVNVDTQDEQLKRQRRIWLGIAGIAADRDGNVLKDKDGNVIRKKPRPQ